jgi:hypothetical protein
MIRWLEARVLTSALPDYCVHLCAVVQKNGRPCVATDKGYLKIEDIEACEKAGILPYVPRPQRGPSVRAGLFRKDEFRYDADSATYHCSAVQRLHAYSSSLARSKAVERFHTVCRYFALPLTLSARRQQRNLSSHCGKISYINGIPSIEPESTLSFELGGKSCC